MAEPATNMSTPASAISLMLSDADAAVNLERDVVAALVDHLARLRQRARVRPRVKGGRIGCA